MNNPLPTVGLRDVFRVDTIGAGLGYVFPQGSFDAVGTYFDLTGSALLSVNTITFTPPPEPATLLLTGTGILAMVSIARRK